ncbi:putative EF-hand calcium-binding domain protein [Aspergillus campestris IBT 28561]|uniref:EF-hand calcium-binding domain protein n=1 Tax=Aspergillus campestris (strain IBT 28561) TaxID=1392248 RepID=A0A2I1D5G8_ASPC2|nr:putative EF-hand calcium-binding domain protein [Aspergillus campestris IBT 28561]PKY05108.1 putative EF-hand calcium-binding domain protein [Aspergillus campestris IBT 28561]
MKILCLHGRGTSGAIFKSQTSAIRARLKDTNIQFDFLDGLHSSPPAPGIDLFYEPPYFTYWKDDTAAEMRQTSTWLKAYIAQHGPYDAVLTFSQGCALATSALLLHEAEEPHAPPPFKAAIFICGGSPLPIMESVGYEISARAWDLDRRTRKALAAQADSASILERGSERWSGGGDVLEGISVDEVRGEIGGGPVKIGIPTVHVYGKKDPRFVASLQLAETCVAERRRVYDHGGGHEIPRLEAVSTTIAGLIRWALKEGGALEG